MFIVTANTYIPTLQACQFNFNILELPEKSNFYAHLVELFYDNGGDFLPVADSRASDM